jgi:CRP-like cAMP-binding protein
VPFFNAPNPEERDKFVAAVALKLVPTAFPPSETVYSPGEAATAMFIVTRGLVRVRAAVLAKGAFFGEEMLMHDAVRSDSASTLSYVDASQLFRGDLWALLGDERRTGVISKTFFETRGLVRKATVRMALRKVVLEIGRSVIVLKKDNWAKWGKQYKRMSAKEVAAYKVRTSVASQPGVCACGFMLLVHVQGIQ